MHYKAVLITPEVEPVTLQEAKDFMTIDYPDFDSLISMLIKAAIAGGEKETGLLFRKHTVTVYDNYPKEYKDNNGSWRKNGYESNHSSFVYPVKPVAELADGGDTVNYTYVAGYDAETLPFDLRVAILKDVATGFAYRQNGVAEAVNQTLNASIYTYRDHIVSPMFGL